MEKLLTPDEWWEKHMAEWRKERDRKAAMPEAIEARQKASDAFLERLAQTGESTMICSICGRKIKAGEINHAFQDDNKVIWCDDCENQPTLDGPDRTDPGYWLDCF